MAELAIFAKIILALWLGLEAFGLVAAVISSIGESDDIDTWPVKYVHNHPTYSDDELLQFDVRNREHRHAFYRDQVRRKALALLSNTWPAIWWRRIVNHDSVEEE